MTFDTIHKASLPNLSLQDQHVGFAEMQPRQRFEFAARLISRKSALYFYGLKPLSRQDQNQIQTSH
jgi:hypothetical protein